MFDILSVNWTKQPLTDEQMLVLRNVAARHMRARRKRAVTNFKHSLCEGSVTRGKDGIYGMVSGTFFHADLGTVGGERWTCDFLLPRGSEDFIVDDDTIIVSSRPFSTSGFEERIVNAKKASIGDTVDAPSQSVH